ncbi:MAG: AmmeMemoRadiSam system protein B, partial [bacterium]|nr:AmmeMemoRadiSam system protein B [bacterium]
MKKYILVYLVLLILSITSETFSRDKLNIASGVVPHHLLAQEIIDDFFKYIFSREKPETIILLSPDHWHSAALHQENSFITVALEPGKEEFNHLKVDSNLLRKLAEKNKIVLNNPAVVSEFGITNLLPFMEKYFPETKILPLLIPAKISKEQVKQLVNSIDEVAPVRTILIASVDFSHYLPWQAANFHDL